MRHSEILQLLEYGASIALRPNNEIATIILTTPALRQNIAAAQVRGLLRRQLIRFEQIDETGIRYYVYNCDRIPGTEPHSLPPREPLQLSGAEEMNGKTIKPINFHQLTLPGMTPHFGEKTWHKSRRIRSNPQQLSLL